MANPDDNLDALFDAWDKTTGDGRDAERARQICDTHVTANPDQFNDLEARLEELKAEGKDNTEIIADFVEMIDGRREAANIFRDSGMEAQARQCDDDKLRIDVWLMHRFDPQNIGGEYHATLRIPNHG